MSTSGSIFLINDGPVSWSSRKQRSISTSSTESEYIACCEATKEAVWLRRVLEGVNHSQEEATTVYVDNQSAIKLVKNPELHSRSKHIEVQYHYVREQALKSRIKVEYISTTVQLADINTKALTLDTFKRLRDKIVKTN
jgi:hypothetical protein